MLAQLFGIRVNLDESGLRGKRGFAETQREVQFLAQEQDQIGFKEAVVCSVHPGIVDPSRAVHRKGRYLGGLSQLRDLLPTTISCHGGARDDQGTFGSLE
tara:strand:+ start:171 stop:470 length:300 start_codon:yes stop_codon:yes gene_type:complete